MIKDFDIKAYLKEQDGVMQTRTFSLSGKPMPENKTRGVFDKENRLVEFSLSSEEPYLRSFGWEILSHDPKHVDMSRLKNGSNLFLNHDTRGLVLGVIEDARIENGRIIEVVRFSKNPEPTLYFNDIADGIRGKISVGYTITDMVDTGEVRDGEPVYKVMFAPFESSLVGVAADDTIGVGRSLQLKEIVSQVVETKVLDTPKLEEKEIEVKEETKNLTINEGKKMTEENKTATIDVVKENSQYIANMKKIGETFGKTELAKDFIIEKKTEAELYKAITDLFDKDPAAFVAKKGNAPDDLGMNKKELNQWSLMSFARAWEDRHNGKTNGVKCFEAEVSQQIEENFKKEASKTDGQFQRASGIFIPKDVMNGKAFRAMSSGSATAGGNLIPTTLRPDLFIDALSNADITSQLGFTILNDLRGGYTIPRRTSRATMAWVAENGSAAESTGLYDLVTLAMKTVTGQSICSREQRLQTSPEADMLALQDLAFSIGLAQADAIFNGTGSSNQITGILAQSGINSISPGASGDAPTHALMNQMKKECRIDNVMGELKLIINAATEYALAVTPKVTAEPIYLLEDGKVAGMQTYLTNMLPSNITKGGSGATLSKAIALYAPDVLIGYWSGLDITIDPYSYSSDGRVKFVAHRSMDLQLRHPESVTVFADIITA